MRCGRPEQTSRPRSRTPRAVASAHHRRRLIMDNTWTWTPIAIPPQPLLVDLRSRVFERSEKRSPKWKFRLVPDLILQIQPKLSTALARFECLAILREN